MLEDDPKSRRHGLGRWLGDSRYGLWLWLCAVLLTVVVAAAVHWLREPEHLLSDGFSPNAETATVVRVVDGDTIVVEVSGVQERVRLLNIDTPETVHPDIDVECGGPESAERLNDLVNPGEVVVLEFDQERRDHYDRLLAGVFTEELFINEQLALEGWGEPVHYPPNDRFLEPIESAWEQAEAEAVGVFSEELGCATP